MALFFVYNTIYKLQIINIFYLMMMKILLGVGIITVKIFDKMKIV